MGDIRNILFIMCDQLRWDYLSCAGHPTLQTPNIDRLAAGGVRFSRAFVQSPVCGPSRMSAYTGRYMLNHGSSWNSVPLSIGERTLGDYLRPLGMRTALVGKTHMAADRDGMARLGVDPASNVGVLAAQCGFEPMERDDGLHPSGFVDPALAYNEFLTAKGYDGDNPWHDWANSAQDPGGEILSGWYMKNARLPARVREEDSETPYMIDRAMDFMSAQGADPWCLHLSFIKPHWPYMAPAPYNDMFGANQILPAHRVEAERDDPHPVVAAYMDHTESVNFQRDEVRDTVIPTYMGLVKQIDDHLGRLFQAMDASGRMDDTLIVFTSDHGDYLGDHWLGEKELFHEPVVRVPMIVRDPAAAADPTRGTVDDRMVELVDLVPTFIDAAGGEVPPHQIDGLSLMPALRGGPDGAWREAVFSELDYAFRPARQTLGLAPGEARAFMVRTERWKYVHYEGFRPQLFDLEKDPDEFHDFGEDPAHEDVRSGLHARLFTWLAGRKYRTTMADDDVEKRTASAHKRGIIIGEW
jgi:arylsulfatase A-like enzyme